jgi:hypothetical protein
MGLVESRSRLVAILRGGKRSDHGDRIGGDPSGIESEDGQVFPAVASPQLHEFCTKHVSVVRHYLYARACDELCMGIFGAHV